VAPNFGAKHFFQEAQAIPQQVPFVVAERMVSRPGLHKLPGKHFATFEKGYSQRYHDDLTDSCDMSGEKIVG